MLTTHKTTYRILMNGITGGWWLSASHIPPLNHITIVNIPDDINDTDAEALEDYMKVFTLINT